MKDPKYTNTTDLCAERKKLNRRMETRMSQRKFDIVKELQRRGVR